MINAVISDVADALGIDVDDIQTDNDEDDTVVAKLKHVSAKLIDEFQAAKEAEGGSMGDKIDEIVNEIADAMGENAEGYQSDGDEGDEHVARLRYFTRRVTDEYTAMKENNG